MNENDHSDREHSGHENDDPMNDDLRMNDDLTAGPPPADELDGLLRDWHERNADEARAGRDRLMRALAAEGNGRLADAPRALADVANDGASSGLRGDTLPASHDIAPSLRIQNDSHGRGGADASTTSPHLVVSTPTTSHGPTGTRSAFRRIAMNRYSPAAAAVIALATLIGILAPSTVGKTFADVVMVPNGGRLDAMDASGRLIGACPLKHTDVDVAVTGRFTRVTLRQRYENPYDEKIEAVYTFPLSHRAAVDRMTMTVGDRVVIGEVHERQQARAIYQAAVRQGHVASLLEQERPNIFTQSVANIEPGAEVIIEISYVELLEEKDGEFSFAFPMVVAPRYIPGGATSSEPRPDGLEARHGVIELAPSDLQPVQPGDTSVRGELDAARLRALINRAAPVMAPTAEYWSAQDAAGQPVVWYQFEAIYPDGSRDYGTLYTDGTGNLNGRWFHVDLASKSDGGTGYASGSDQVPDAARITPMPVKPPMRAGHTIDVTVTIDTGGPGILDLTTHLHDCITQTELVRPDGLARELVLTLEDADEIPNRDFVLTWSQTADTITEQVFTHTGEQGGFFTLILNPPARVTNYNAVPRELIFVLDTSGSMNGRPIEKAKETMAIAIDALRPRDTFNLITFAGDTHILWDAPRSASDANLAEAQAFLASRSGRGGTEMMTAINAALERNADAPEPIITLRELVNLPADGRPVEIAIRELRNRRISALGEQDAGGPRSPLFLYRFDAQPTPIGEWLRHYLTLSKIGPGFWDNTIQATWETRDGERVLVMQGWGTVTGRPVRIVCFMTDGQVGNDGAIIEAVKRNAHTTRVFSFGIGNSVNRSLLDKMSEAGDGAVEYVLQSSDADVAVERFSRRIQSPVLTDIELEFSEGLVVEDRQPARIRDLFDEAPIILHGRYNTPGTGTVTIRGNAGNGPFERVIEIDLPADAPDHDVLATLWARAKVASIMDRDRAAADQGTFPAEWQAEVVDLGESFNIMTKFTSFVAVERLRVTVGGEPRLIAVPIELPEGQSWEGNFGQRLWQFSEQVDLATAPLQRNLELAERLGTGDARQMIQTIGLAVELTEANRFGEARAAVQQVALLDVDNAWSDEMTQAIADAETAWEASEVAMHGKHGPAAGASDAGVGVAEGKEVVDSVAEEHEVIWQQAVATYKDLESKIRKADIRHDYAEARRLIEQAEDVIRANRRYASSAPEHEKLRGEAEELERFVAERRREWNESEVARKQEEIRAYEQHRIRVTPEAKDRQVSKLMVQAEELRKERRYEDAIAVLNQVRVIHPSHERAKWMKDALEDVAVHSRNQWGVAERQRQSQDLVLRSPAVLAPRLKDQLYPKNWAEISAKASTTEQTVQWGRESKLGQIGQNAPASGWDDAQAVTVPMYAAGAFAVEPDGGPTIDNRVAWGRGSRGFRRRGGDIGQPGAVRYGALRVNGGPASPNGSPTDIAAQFRVFTDAAMAGPAEPAVGVDLWNRLRANNSTPKQFIAPSAGRTVQPTPTAGQPVDIAMALANGSRFSGATFEGFKGEPSGEDARGYLTYGVPFVSGSSDYEDDSSNSPNTRYAYQPQNEPSSSARLRLKSPDVLLSVLADLPQLGVEFWYGEPVAERGDELAVEASPRLGWRNLLDAPPSSAKTAYGIPKPQSAPAGEHGQSPESMLAAALKKLNAGPVPPESPGSGSIILEASEAPLDDIKKALEAPDARTAGDADTRFLKLRNADASQVAQTLRKLFRSKKQGLGSSEGPPAPGAPAADRIKISADRPSNLIIVSASSQDMAEIESIISQLDAEQHSKSAGQPASIQAAGEPVDEDARSNLSRLMPEIEFDGVPLERVVDCLNESTELTIFANWDALESVGVSRDLEVTVTLPAAGIGTAVGVVLEALGEAGADLSYMIDGDVVQISTRADLVMQVAEQRTRDMPAPRIAVPDGVAMRVAALAVAGRFDQARGLAGQLVAGAPDYDIGVDMQTTLENAALSADDRAARLVELGRQAADRLAAASQRNRRIARRLDERLLELALTPRPPKGAASVLTIREGAVLVSVLTADKSAATLDALKTAGLAVESVSQSANVVVGYAPIESLTTIAVADAVRRVSPI